MPIVLIGGYYGAGNIGDEAILMAMLDGLHSQRPDTSFIVTSWDPEKTRQELNVEAVYWKDISALLNAALRADLVILGGGGIFHDYWGINPETYLRKGFWDLTAFGSLPLLAKLLDIPCMIYAVGVGPLKSGLAIEHTRLAFERCQVATVRDAESLDLLEQIGINKTQPSRLLEVLPDPAFTLTTSPDDDRQVAGFLSQRNIPSDIPLLCISLRYWDLPGPPWTWLPDIAEGLNKFLAVNDNVQVILLPFQVQEASPHTNDANVLKKLYEYVAESRRFHLIEDTVSPRFAQALIKHCSVLLAMRFHSLVFGVNVGTPVIALSYAPKISSLMKSAGLNDFCNLTLSPAPEALAVQLQRALDERKILRPKMAAKHVIWKAEAQKHTTLALSLLSQSERKNPTFSQQFALEQTRLLEKADTLAEQQKSRIDVLQSQVQQINQLRKQLNEIQASRFLKIARFYYWFMQNYLSKFLRMLRKAMNTIQIMYGSVSASSSGLLDLQRAVDFLNLLKLKGLFIIVTDLHINDLTKLRVKTLAMLLSKKGWGVILVGGNTLLELKGKKILHVSLESFLAQNDSLAQLVVPNKYFMLTFPSWDLFLTAANMKKNNFHVVYDATQPWFSLPRSEYSHDINVSMEGPIINNANLVIATSKSILERLSIYRRDIQLVESWEANFSNFMNVLEGKEWISL